MSLTKTLRHVSVSPVHHDHGEPSHIELRAFPEWLKNPADVTAVLTPAQAIDLIAQLAQAIRVTRP